MEDRRKYPRFPASEMAYIVGLGSPAHITDISYGGLGVRYKGGNDLPDEFTVDLLQASKSVIIDRVKCRKTRDETMGKVTLFSYIQERRLGIEFLEPSPETFDSLVLFKGNGTEKPYKSN
jgi:hypothetical protein